MKVRRLTAALIVAIAATACGTGDESGDAPDSTTTTTATGAVVDVGDAVDGGRVPVIVDYSPTTSDVAALLYVIQHPSADLLAVTLAGTGESHCDRGVANTRALLALVGLPDIPVACGRDQPIGAGNEWPADWREAADRLDGLDLAPTKQAGGDTDAAELLGSIAADHSPVMIVALGPLTNLAVALGERPDLLEHVGEVVTMGGAIAVEGNATNGAAEWNYFVDPTAVDIVLRSGIPLAQELEAIEQRADNVVLTPEDVATIRAFFTGFWTGADEHLQTLRATLGELDPPATVRSEHDGYVAAVDALIETTDDRLAEIATRDAAEQLSGLWESDDEIEAINTACEALGAAASGLGLDVETCP